MFPLVLIPIVLFSLAVGGYLDFGEARTGIVLMHGKGGTSRPKSPVGKLMVILKNAGFMVVAPDMPWSRTRGFDKGHKDSMTEIDTFVEGLKRDGATSIVVGGHSLGANAALAYGARRKGLAGILAIAPGHVIELKGFQRKMAFDYKRAKGMVDSGRGGQKDDFKNFNQGKQSTISTNARIYLSWFSPDGPAAMPTNAKNLKPGTPLMWIIGEKDRMMKRGRDYAFNKAPKQDNNAYVVIKGGHKATPTKGAERIIQWLDGL